MMKTFFFVSLFVLKFAFVQSAKRCDDYNKTVRYIKTLFVILGMGSRTLKLGMICYCYKLLCILAYL
jgi:hypothetical protein